MDDILIAGRAHDELDALKTQLKKSFEMKDLGQASHILGICASCVIALSGSFTCHRRSTYKIYLSDSICRMLSLLAILYLPM